jgi:hypothetical protein
MELLLVEHSNSDVLLACLFWDVQFSSVPVLLFVLLAKVNIMPLFDYLQKIKLSLGAKSNARGVYFGN